MIRETLRFLPIMAHRFRDRSLRAFSPRPVWDSSDRAWHWRYFCPKCKAQLTAGPTGGGINLVCETCRINYGCLPGGEG